MPESRSKRAQGCGTGALVAGLLLRALEWGAVVLGLPGSIAAWRPVVDNVEGYEVAFHVTRFLADLAVIGGLVLLGPTLAGWAAAGFSAAVKTTRRRHETRVRRQRLKETIGALWSLDGKWLTRLVDGPQEIQIGQRETEMHKLGVIEIRTGHRRKELSGGASVRVSLCALTDLAAPVVRELANPAKERHRG